MSTTKKCPMCAEEIEADALVCRYCGAKFDVKRKGYCQNCRAIREVNETDQCKVCGNAVIDIRVENNLIEEAAPKPAFASEPAIQPEIRKSGTKKTAAIIGTIVMSLLCGLPGVLSLFLGGVSLYGLLSPGIPPDVLANITQSGTTVQQLTYAALIFIGIGIFLILIPIVFGILTLLKKKNPGKVLAQFSVACLILVGIGILTVLINVFSDSRTNLASILAPYFICAAIIMILIGLGLNSTKKNGVFSKSGDLIIFSAMKRNRYLAKKYE